MKKLLYISIISVIAFSLGSCSQENDEMLATDLKSTATTCQPVNTPITYELVFRDIVNPPNYFYPVGNIVVSHDATNLFITVKASFGFVPTAGNIDIGFFKTLPLVRPDHELFVYHFDASGSQFELTLPLDGITFEDDPADLNGFDCGEQIKMIIHVSAFNSSSDAVDSWAWTHINVGSLTAWYKYIGYTPCCCSDETAWAAGTRYLTKGNWATFTPYVPGTTVDLFAGQTFLAGTVTFGEVIDGMVALDFTLFEGFSLRNPEAIKIEDYEVAPLGVKPVVGSFAYKFETLEDISVPAANFYGIHLDLFKCQ